MTEHPILFSGPMVRAILDGRKTQTRRVVSPPPPGDCLSFEVGRYHPTVVDRHGEEQPGSETFGAYTEDGWWAQRCPYGAPGDRLWVREGHRMERYGGLWSHFDHAEARVEYSVYCGSGNGCAPLYFMLHGEDKDNFKPTPPGKWRRSIHMPRWASRVTLEITEVRVERVQAISAEDAIAEGLSSNLREHDAATDLRDQFRDLWDSINGTKPGRSWEDNPWVWAITFKKA